MGWTACRGILTNLSILSENIIFHFPAQIQKVGATLQSKTNIPLGLRLIFNCTEGI